ncbi:DUF7139 domain-containing protein [Halolamina salifodinae]|uniref:Uncharacterized protein n=1 Tax=Halolamina salifodinae TaxID=1202767 RepID=A0A8T4GUR6_9EURY|nr:ribonuclease BN [Halolamina salifodinae]MBP1985813.1 hypothetical protein [Halolamina salifodinae]
MTSLSEVYKPDAEFQTSLRRLYAGLGLFALGGLLVIVAIFVAATGVVGPQSVAREWAGILGGLGVPAAVLGVFAVLPSGKRTRVAAVIGAALSLLGVALFVHAYPCQWVGSNCLGDKTLLTLPVALLYSAGVITTLWCLFTGIVNFESRNNPGGTARVEVTTQGETKVIEVPTSELSKFSGSMGVLGGTPEVEAPDRPGAGGGSDAGVASDGGASASSITDVNTGGAFVDEDDIADAGPGPAGPAGPSTGSATTSQSSGSETTSDLDSAGSKPPRRENRDSAAGQSGSSVSDPGTTGHAAGDTQTGSSGEVKGLRSGGNSARRDDDWEPTGSTPETAASGPDRDSYCGSCTHFEYVQTEHGMQPYCGAHEELMDDMDACDDYTPRNE